jgi:transposase
MWYNGFMEITSEQFGRISQYFPTQRGNVRIDNLSVLNGILYVAKHGCKWRGLPRRFGPWHTIYTRMSRWAKSGVLDRIFEALQRENVIKVRVEGVSLDSTIVKVHPDGTGALKETEPRQSESPGEDGPPKFIWLPRVLGRP